jgi:hypothetical protein
MTALRRTFIRIAAAALVLSSAAAHAAPIDGLWCGTGLLHEFSLKLKQLSREQIEGTLMRGDAARQIQGSIDGATVYTQGTRYGALVLEAADSELRVTGGDGVLALARGTSFRRASGGACGS